MAAVVVMIAVVLLMSVMKVVNHAILVDFTVEF